MNKIGNGWANIWNRVRTNRKRSYQLATGMAAINRINDWIEDLVGSMRRLPTDGKQRQGIGQQLL